MNKVVKPTFEEAFEVWKTFTGKKCVFKSWIKPRFNIWRFRQEFYFYYKPLNYADVDVEDELFTIFIN